MQICLPPSPSFNPALGFFTVLRLGRLLCRRITRGGTSGAQPLSARMSRAMWCSLVPPTPTFYSRGSHHLWTKGREPRALWSWRRAWDGQDWDTAWGAWESGFMAPCSRVSSSLLPSITFRPHRDFRESGVGSGCGTWEGTSQGQQRATQHTLGRTGLRTQWKSICTCVLGLNPGKRSSEP